MAATPPSPSPQRPLFWAALAAVGGVACGCAFRLLRPGWPWLALAAALLLTAAPRVSRRRFAAVLLLAVSLGGWRAAVALDRLEHHPLLALADATHELVGVVREPPEARSNGDRFDLALQWARLPDGPWQRCGGGLRVNVQGASGVVLGDRVRLTVSPERPATAGNPGEASYRERLARDGIVLVAKLDQRPEVLAHHRAGPFAHLSERLRAALCGSIRRLMPGPAADQSADLLNSLVFGVYAAPLTEPLEEAFRRCGLSHLLVASGTQVSILILLVLALGRLLPLPQSLLVALGCCLIGAYVMVTGFEASIVRAAVMGLFVLGALAGGHDYDLLTSLAASAVVLLAWRPLWIGDVGFQLSYAATAGLVLLGLPWAARCEPLLGRWLGACVAFTAGSQVFVAPLMVYHFRRVALTGLVSNLPAVPLSGVIVPLGLAAAVLGCLWAAPARLLLAALRILLNWLLASVGVMSRWRPGFREGVTMSPSQMALAVVVLLGLSLAVALEPDDLRARLRWLTRDRLAAGLALLLAGTTGWFAWSSWTAALTLTVMSVGEGDCLLLRGPTGRTLLVDGGPRSERDGFVRDAGEAVVVPSLMLAGVRHLDDVLLTHEHADHAGGLATVVRAYPRARIWLEPEAREHGAAEVERLLVTAEETGSSVGTVVAGQLFDLGGGASAKVIWPEDPPGGGGTPQNDPNNRSVVLSVHYGRTAMLLAADLEAPGESALLQSGEDLRANVLKVPHQGSSSSCTAPFLAAVQPSFAAISTGENQWGHPSPAVVSRLRAMGARVDRTDVAGQLVYRSDGQTVSMSSYGRR